MPRLAKEDKPQPKRNYRIVFDTRDTRRMQRRVWSQKEDVHVNNRIPDGLVSARMIDVKRDLSTIKVLVSYKVLQQDGSLMRRERTVQLPSTAKNIRLHTFLEAAQEDNGSGTGTDTEGGG